MTRAKCLMCGGSIRLDVRSEWETDEQGFERWVPGHSEWVHLEDGSTHCPRKGASVATPEGES